MTRKLNTKWTKTATGFVVALLLLAVFPLMGTVAADNSAGSPDDLVVVVKPRHATLDGENAVLVSAEHNRFIFDFELLHADGTPFLVTEYAIDLNTVDPTGPENPYVPGASLVYSKTFTSSTPVSTGTIAVPAAPVMFHETPFAGFAITLLAVKDELGAYLHDANGTLPSGQYSLLANALVSEGRFAEADLADEGFTPLFFTNGQLSDLGEPGNPVLNPGFEIGGTNVSQEGYQTHTPPWVLKMGDGSPEPLESWYYLAGACGGSGSCASIHMEPADNGRNVRFGQLFASYVQGVHWEASDNLTLEFDVRTNGISGYYAPVAIHYLDAITGKEKHVVRQLSTAVPGGYEMTHVTYNFSAAGTGGSAPLVPEGAKIIKLWFLLDQPWTQHSIILLDSVRINGADLVAGELNDNDLVDGYSAFIYAQDSASDANEQIAMSRTLLGDGSEAYVFELTAMDYTGESAAEIAVKDLPFVFQLLDEDYLPAFSHAPEDVAFATSQAFRFVDSEGAESDRILVVVPADTLAGQDPKVPWVFFDVPTTPTYNNTWSTQSEPTSAYYSPLRNTLKDHSIADQLDYAATPVVFTDSIGSVAATPELTIGCIYALSGETCVADPTPTITVNYTSTSRVVETVTIELVESANESNVLATGTLSAPVGTIEFTLTTDQVDALTASGSPRVKAIASNTLFAVGTTTRDLRLTNVLPTPDFEVNLPTTGAHKGATVTFVDTSTDDNPISTVQWNITFLNDPTPDLDFDSENKVVVNEAGSTISYTLPDDGIYSVTMTVQDSDGEVASTTKTFEAVNLLPEGTIVAAKYIKNSTVTPVQITAADTDGGFVKRIDWDLDGDGAFELNVIDNPEAPQVMSFAQDGEYTIAARLWDDDAQDDTQTTVVEFPVVVDTVKAETSIQAPNASANNGWNTGPTAINISRSDDRSGVLSTQLSILAPGRTMPTITNEAGDENLTRVLTGDGIHVVRAKSTDRSGNVGDEVVETVKIDTTAPRTSFVRGPVSPLGYEVVPASEETTITVSAIDTAAPVTAVKVFVEGTGTPYLAEKQADGTWTVTIDTTGYSGAVEVNAIATNEAGLANTGADAPSMTLFVVNPAMLGPSLG